MTAGAQQFRAVQPGARLLHLLRCLSRGLRRSSKVLVCLLVHDLFRWLPPWVMQHAFDHVTGLFCMAFGTNIVAQEARARNTELHSAACYQHDSRPCSCWFGGCGWQLGLCARCLATWKHPISQACSCYAQDGD